MRGENPMLFCGRQAGKEWQDFGVRQIEVRQGLGGLTDLLLTS